MAEGRFGRGRPRAPRGSSRRHDVGRQTSMVRTLATDRRQLQLVIAPASAGKTTALRVLAYTWTGGAGHTRPRPLRHRRGTARRSDRHPRGHPARPSTQLWWETSSSSAWSSWAGIMRVGDLMPRGIARDALVDRTWLIG